MKKTELEKETSIIMNKIYLNYGSGTGVLFGIPAELKSSVMVIVKLTLQLKTAGCEE